jgi:hypothetical protein
VLGLDRTGSTASREAPGPMLEPDRTKTDFTRGSLAARFSELSLRYVAL